MNLVEGWLWQSSVFSGFNVDIEKLALLVVIG
jgi:hypothetical protein